MIAAEQAPAAELSASLYSFAVRRGSTVFARREEDGARGKKEGDDALDPKRGRPRGNW